MTPEGAPEGDGAAFPLRAWGWAALNTVSMCAVGGAIAWLVTGKVEFLFYALGLAVVLELLAGLAMLLDSFGLPGGLMVGLFAFFPWSLLALLLFRKEVPDRWLHRTLPRDVH